MRGCETERFHPTCWNARKAVPQGLSQQVKVAYGFAYTLILIDFF
ncbi:MAG: hypothetical protein LZF86_100176 [Nitrospira sp.]|nr:MAG: hypothetical protein LZF86_100176 [Nitrospira sp.]